MNLLNHKFKSAIVFILTLSGLNIKAYELQKATPKTDGQTSNIKKLPSKSLYDNLLLNGKIKEKETGEGQETGSKTFS